MPSWTRPSQTSWALTLPGIVPGAVFPHPPAPCPVTAPLCSAAAVPCHQCPSLGQPQHCSWAPFPGKGCSRCSWTPRAPGWPPQPHRSPRCPTLTSLAVQLGFKTALKVHFWFTCPHPNLRTNLSTWEISWQAMTVASVPWHWCLSSAIPPHTIQPKVTGDRPAQLLPPLLWCQGS